MHKPSIAQLVYNALFPRPRSTDPGNFAAHINRHLVPEVRVEVNAFYGPLDCIEAQYPGLDYSYGPHRMRLGRFPWHRRLFRAFDELGLTEQEISELCCWEGTKSARQRYEAEEGITVQDTTGDSIPVASPDPMPRSLVHSGIVWSTGSRRDDRSDDTVRASDSRPPSELTDYMQDEFELVDEYSDEEMESCGLALNNRLLAAMEARDQGVDVPLDEDWEQWLKEAGERGGYAEVMHAIRSNQPLSRQPEPEASSSIAGHEITHLAPVTTLSAEAFLLSTASPPFPRSPVLPRAVNHASGTAR